MPSDSSGQAARLLQEGIRLYQGGFFQKAWSHLEQALHLYREISDLAGEARSLAHLGNAHYYASDFENAERWYRQHLALARQTRDLLEEGKALGNLGNLAWARRDLKEALEKQEQSLDIARRLGDLEGEGASEGSLGLIYHGMGDYSRALACHRRHLEIARQRGDRRAMARAYGGLGFANRALARYVDAIQDLERFLALTRETGDLPAEGTALSALADAYLALGDSEKAISLAQSSLDLARSIGDRAGEAAALGNLGSAYHDQGRYGEAVTTYAQYLRLARELDDPLAQARALGGLGIAYHSACDTGQAVQLFEQSLAIAQRLGHPLFQATALGNLGRSYHAQGNYPQALQAFRQSLELGQRLGDRLGVGKDLTNLGICYLDMGDLPNAEAALRQGMAVWESVAQDLSSQDQLRVSAGKVQGSTYRLLQRVLVRAGRVEEALEISERGRARSFADLIARGAPAPSEAFVPPSPLSAEAIRRLARDTGMTLVEYTLQYEDLPGDELRIRATEVYVWVVSPAGDLCFRSIPLHAFFQSGGFGLEGLVVEAREALQAGGRDVVSQHPQSLKGERLLQILYDCLILPIRELLPQDPDALVTFIPSGPLLLVPFAALRTATGTSLVEQHTLGISPSIQVLELLAGREVGGRGAVVAGSPTMPSIHVRPGQPAVRLRPLPYAAQEAIAVAQRLGTYALTGNAATRSTVLEKLPQARIIHLATHGILGDVHDTIPGAIALTPSPGDDGLLRSAEILGLRLQAELVVLSACDTAGGRITEDGMIGLSRSWLSAGAASLVVSLVPVPDAPTGQLMIHFYKSLERTRDKARALRHAMLATKRHYPHPRNWAGFILVGVSSWRGSFPG